MARMTSLSHSPSLDVKRLAVVIAVLLSLSLCCAARGGARRELLDASDGLLTGTQRALFTFTVKAVPRTPAPVFSNSSYRTNTGQLVATFACVPKPTTTLGTYRCTASSLANITVPFKPVNRPKALVNAGFFSNPTAFYSAIKVNGIMLRGSITASVANL
ncbi:unnamed protein product [Closterium sp. Naga37s-1]|nr:unnamed protein product [Closterium sp. Naga37s-1]